jgi:chromosome segregation ATPase
MSENALNDINNTLNDIRNDLPSETSLYDVEKKLDKLIELMENQNDLTEQLVNKMENIYQEIPGENNVSTSRIEDKLEKISDKLEDVNSNLGDISSNTYEH